MTEIDSVLAVQRMQAFIDRHLAEPITLRQLADVAGYSPWHSARVFKELLQKSPFEYIRALRLSRAALLLRDGTQLSDKPKVIDVAFDFVFDSHEGFTRAFSRQFGITPIDYRRRTPPIRLFMPYPARGSNGFAIGNEQKGKTDTMSNTSMNTTTVFAQVIERPARKVMLLRGTSADEYWAYCNEVGCDVWGILTSVKEALYEPVGMWLPDALMPPGTSRYVQGVELPLDFDNEVPEGFDMIELPPAKMMVFQGEPYDDAEFPTAIGQVHEAVSRFKPELYGYAWADDEAPRFQLEPQGYRGYIEARPVRNLA